MDLFGAVVTAINVSPVNFVGVLATERSRMVKMCILCFRCAILAVIALVVLVYFMSYVDVQFILETFTESRRLGRMSPNMSFSRYARTTYSPFYEYYNNMYVDE